MHAFQSFQSFQPSPLSQVETPNCQSWQGPWPITHTQYNHSSSSIEPISSSPVKYISKTENPKLGTTPYAQSCPLDAPQSNSPPPSRVRPESQLPAPQQRSPKRQKHRKSAKLECRSQTYILGHGILDSKDGMATNPAMSGDHLAVWDDCEQSLEEVRSELAQGGRLLFHRRFGFLR